MAQTGIDETRPPTMAGNRTGTPRDGAGRRPTITDVARLAGVSLQTVSNVLNGQASGRMRPTTEERVWDAIRKLDYYPDARAVRLRRKRAFALAVTVLDPSPRFLSDAFTAEVLSGAAHRARELGYRILLEGGASALHAQSIANILRSGEADAMIVLPSGELSEWVGLLEALSQTKRSVVVVQSQIELPSPGIPTAGSVNADDHGAGVELGRLLTSLGHTRTAFVTTRASWPAVKRRLEGVCDAFSEEGILPPATIASDGWTVEAGARATTAFLRQQTTPPTAILGANDVLAAGILVAARSHGLRVPQALTVVGFDDLDIAAAVSPPLTTSRVPGFQIGALAASEAIGAVEDAASYQPQSHTLPTELVLRASHGAAAASPDAR